MRVLFAPDGFSGTLTAVEAAAAMAEGWRFAARDDQLDLLPLSDGGPGFVDVLQTALGGRLLSGEVTGPLGRPVPASVLLVEDTVYVESAQACGLALLPDGVRDPGGSTTHGVGELLLAALDAGARRIVVGLGGSATTDGGAGMLAALGARPADGLRHGGAGLAGLGYVDLAPARSRMRGVELVAATDVDNPLLGPQGASAVYGPQKGAGPQEVRRLDAALRRFAGLAEPSRPEPVVAERRGAGAAGGLGYGLMLLGAERVPGVATVHRAVGLSLRVANADLVVTGEGSFDSQSLRGKVVSGVADVATAHGRPCLVLAGRVAVSEDDMRRIGVHGAYALADAAGSAEAAMAGPAEWLAQVAAKAARTWSRPAG